MLKYCLKQPFVLLILLLAAVIGGIYAYGRLSVDLFPNMNYPLINVITHYPGGSSKDVETLVTRPIETQMSTLQNVRRISSVSQQGLSIVTVEFEWGESGKDARQLAAQALSVATGSLPAGAKPVLENLGSTLLQIAEYGVIYNRKKTRPGELRSYLETRLANFLKTVNGVNRVEVVGGEEKSFVINPDNKKLRQNNLGYQDIADKVAANNLQLLAGYYSAYHQDRAVTGKGMIRGLDDLRNVALNDKPLFLKNVASVHVGSLPQRYAVYINGKPGITLLIYKNAKANTMQVSKGVAAALKTIEPSLPAGARIVNIYDQAKVIGDAVSSLKNDIIIGIVLVAIMMILFLGSLGTSLLVALSVPVIAIVTMIFMNILGMSLNMITLGAMAVAVGMVVDDSIIIIENIIRHRELGKGAFEAARDGTREIAAADASGTLTTVASFIPFLFLGGLAGRFAGPFGITISIMLLLSLLISLSIVPALMARQKKYKFKEPLAMPLVSALVAVNHRLLDTFLHHKKTVIFGSILLFIASSTILFYLPVSFVPKIDEGSILFEYTMPSGTSLQESNKIGHLVEEIALKNPQVTGVSRRTGSEGGTFQVEPVNKGELVIKLKPANERKVSIFRVMKELEKETDKIPGIITIYHQVTAEKLDESMSGLPTLFGLTVYGSNDRKLQKIADEIAKTASHVPGIDAVVNNSKNRVPQLLIVPKREALARYGINAGDLLHEARYYIGGKIISRIIKDRRVIPIFLRDQNGGRLDLQKIRSIPIKTALGYVPLSRLAETKISAGAAQIEHVNLQRVVTLPMQISGSIPQITETLRQKIAALHLPKGYFVLFGGDYQNLIEMAKSFAVYAIIGALLIYMIISLQLGNALHPLAILLGLPLPFAGAFIAMGITHAELNLSFLIGLITLLGVAVNNGIVLVDYINRYRQEGLERMAAIEKAAGTRTRPILLTMLTAVVALFPIALGIGIGSKMQQSLAICVIGGLLANIFFTLNVLPVIYSILDDKFGRTISRNF